jgi:hypothetical protein
MIEQATTELRWLDKNRRFKGHPNYEPNLVLQQWYKYLNPDDSGITGYWKDVEIVN